MHQEIEHLVARGRRRDPRALEIAVLCDAGDVQLHDVLQREPVEKNLGVGVVVVRFQPDVGQIEQESGAGAREELGQPFRLGHLARSHVEESRDVFHHQRLIEPGLERVGVGHEAVEELLRVERREHVIEVVAPILGVQALEVLRHPRCAVQLGQRSRPLNRALVERLRQLPQVVVQQQRVSLADLGPPRVIGPGRIGHGQVIDSLAPGQFGAEVWIVKCADHQGGHRGR